ARSATHERAAAVARFRLWHPTDRCRGGPDDHGPGARALHAEGPRRRAGLGPDRGPVARMAARCTGCRLAVEHGWQPQRNERARGKVRAPPEWALQPAGTHSRRTPDDIRGQGTAPAPGPDG